MARGGFGSGPEGRTLKYSVLEVEDDLEVIKHRFADFLFTKTPSFLLDKDFLERIGVRKVILDVRQDFLRGQAQLGLGVLMLNYKASTRWMSDSEYQGYGKVEDLTPTGVLAHEVGHFVLEAAETQSVLGDWDTAFDPRTSITGYGTTNPHEDFAESFRLWALNPLKLKELRPNRYKRIEKAAKLLDLKDHTKLGTFTHPSIRSAFQ